MKNIYEISLLRTAFGGTPKDVLRLERASWLAAGGARQRKATCGAPRGMVSTSCGAGAGCA